MLDEELFNDTANTFVCFGRSLTLKDDEIDDKMEKDSFFEDSHNFSSNCRLV